MISRAPAWLKSLAGYAALVLAAPACVASLLSQGGRSSPRLDILTHFTLVYLVMAILAVVAWLVSHHRRRLVLAMALVALASCLSLMAPEIAAWGRPRPAVAPGQARLRLVQFNVWKQNQEPQAALDWLEKVDPDVAALEDSTELGSVVIEAAARRFPYRVTIGDTHLFSKLPITYSKRLDGGSSVMAHIVLPGGEQADIAAIHILWPLFSRLQAAQRKSLLADLATVPRDDLIIAGDFNLTPWSFSLKELDQGFGIERQTHGVPTWPAFSRLIPAFMSIDHIYAGPNWQVVRLERGPRVGSDHYPLLIDLVRRRAP